jgi:CHAT domain-containing protein
VAVEHIQAALEVFAAEVLPAEWAKGQAILGAVRGDAVRGERAENLEHAIGSFRAALAVLTADDDPALWIPAQIGLGQIYLSRVLGDPTVNLERAVGCFEAARAAADQAGFPDLKAQTSRSLAIITIIRATSDGELQTAVPKLRRAVADFKEALRVWTRRRSPYQWATTQAALANAYAALAEAGSAADVGKAVACSNAALEVLTREAFPTDWARIHHNLGGLYATLAAASRPQRAANLARAAGCFHNALMVFEVSGTVVQRRLTGRQLGDAASEAGRWEEAADGYRAALVAHEALYAASLLRTAREAELREAADLHQRAAYALARCGRWDEAALTLEQGRARGLAEAVARDRLDLEEAGRRDPAAAEAYRQAARRLTAVESAQWRSAGERPMFPGGLEELDDLEQSRRKIEQALRPETMAAQAELAGAAERIRAAGVEGFLAQPTLEDIAAVVTPARPLAYVMVTPLGGASLLVRREAQKPATGEGDVAIEVLWAPGDGPDLGPELVRLLVAQVGDEITGGYLPGQMPGAPPNWLPEVLEKLLPVLGERQIGPLAARLAEIGAERVVLVACGELGLLPLHAARYSRDGIDRCLLDEVEVSYTPSARALRSAQLALRTCERSPTLTGVGNPLPVRQPLEPIKFAEVELDGVAACFDDHVDLFYGSAATKEALVRSAEKATHVHLACHGMLRLDQPLSAALVLAREDRLTVIQVLSERPFGNSRLVVASACQTAVTDLTRPLDEAVGLPAAFLEAGAAGVVATLWRVKEASAALVMTRFYEYHLRDGDGPPVSPARALRLAQRWLRDLTLEQLGEYVDRHPALRDAAAPYLRFAAGGSSIRPFDVPYHWAPYVMIGA